MTNYGKTRLCLHNCGGIGSVYFLHLSTQSLSFEVCVILQNAHFAMGCFIVNAKNIVCFFFT